MYEADSNLWNTHCPPYQGCDKCKYYIYCTNREYPIAELAYLQDELEVIKEKKCNVTPKIT